MKHWVLVFFLIFVCGQAMAEAPLCPQGNVDEMNWNERLRLYSKIMFMNPGTDREVCLLDYFMAVRPHFIEETRKGEESYIEFFNEFKMHYSLDAITDNPDHKKFVLEHVDPIILFFQQIWLEEALDRWAERKVKSGTSTNLVLGGGLAALTLVLWAYKPTRAKTTRPLKVLFRVLRPLIPSIAGVSVGTDGLIDRYRKSRKKDYELPKSPFELTHDWFNREQIDLIDAENDKFWADVTSDALGASVGTLAGLTTAEALKLLSVKNKPLTMVLGVASTIVTTNLVSDLASKYQTVRNFEKIVRDVESALFDVEAKLSANATMKAYLALYDAVNEIEIYSLLKVRDFGFMKDEVQKKAIKSCLPSWTEEEVEKHAHKLHLKAEKHFKGAIQLMDYLSNHKNETLKKRFPYFEHRFEVAKEYIRLISDEKELIDNIKQAIARKNECYQLEQQSK